ncbi:MAG: hypothetical protein JW893_08690 [Candidatus Omnitrophica bacterium]|nr:hypothetical protein [Candidatus Omnitrophota bacterium]
MSATVKVSQDVLVLIDKKLAGYSSFWKEFAPVLQHWKFPHRIVDVHASQCVRAIRQAGLVLLIQPYLGKALKRPVIKVIEEALEHQCGLFLAEPSLLENPYRHQTELGNVLPKPMGRIRSNTLRVIRNRHFIATTKAVGEKIDLSSVCEITKIHKKKTPLDIILMAGNNPAFVFLHHPKYRIGCCMLKGHDLIHAIGFGGDFDVFLWKSIIYLARKPFFQLLPKAFVTFRIEDSIGEGNYRYLDHLIRQGFKAHLGLDLNDFKTCYARKLVHYIQNGKVECSAHAFTHYKRVPTEKTDLIYGPFQGGAYSKQKIKKNFERLDEFQNQNRIKFSPVLTYHYCQIGKTALKHLKRLGVRYLGFPFKVNSPLNQVGAYKWRRYPFGRWGLICDYWPDDPDFIVMSALFFPKKVEPDGKIDVSVTSRFDFLFGLKLKIPGKRFNQYREVRDRISRYLRWTNENMFFSTLFTHETLIHYLRPWEFRRIVKDIRRLSKNFHATHARYQDIARYYETRMNTRLQEFEFKGGRGTGTVEGRMSGNLDLAIYEGRGNALTMKRATIDVVKGRRRVRFNHLKGERNNG